MERKYVVYYHGARSSGNNIQYLIISLGFNVNQENFNEEIINIATSLKKEFSKDFSREDIIIKFIENLEKEIEY